MSKKYFGTDGIRGVAYEFLTEKLAYNVGQAIAKVFKVDSIIIGCDTRESSEMLVSNIAKGASQAGIHVLVAGVLSTPMLAYYSKEKHLIGVMITASHNPYHDNGIKIFKYGYKMLDEEELMMESYIDDESVLTAKKQGKIEQTDDVTKHYLKFYKTLNLSKTKLKIAFDTANGATYEIAPLLMKTIAHELTQIGDVPDGRNINLNVGSTHLEAIKAAVSNHAADIGFSFDGDGDRILIIDQHGHTYDGDMIIYIIAKYLKHHDMLKHDTVVLTKMSNPGLIKAFKTLGIHVILTDVGDKYVSHAIMAGGYSIGGEASGHIILNDLLPSGDGLLVAMYVIKILTEMHTDLPSYTKELVSYPLKTKNIKGVNKAVVQTDVIKSALEDAKLILGEDALLLLRPSGTEPLVRITVSHKDAELVDQIIETLSILIERIGAI